MRVCRAESEFEDDAAAEDELESGSGEEEVPDKGVAAGKKRVQRSRASREAAETAAHPRIDFFFKRPAAAPSSSAPAATGASSAEVASPSLGSPAGLSPAGSSAAPAASTASPGQPETSPADASADATDGSEAPPMDCPICLTPIDPNATCGAACMTLPCSHHFHGDCIIDWLRTAQTTCPVCRSGPAGSSTSANSPQPKPPKTAETGKPPVTPAAATTETETETETDAPRSGHSANGVKLGRPPGSGGGSISRPSSRLESAASHRGQGPRSLGSCTRESSATRTSTRKLRTASRPRSELEPPAPALPPPTRPKRADAGVQRGPQLLPHVTAAMLAKVRRINHQRHSSSAPTWSAARSSRQARHDLLLVTSSSYLLPATSY